MKKEDANAGTNNTNLAKLPADKTKLNPSDKKVVKTGCC